MDHLAHIESLIKVLARSETTHGLFVKGPPGIGKSTCVEAALNELGLAYVVSGTYSSPLGLYNALSDVPSNHITVIDDAGGLFQGISLDILKAALAPSAGNSGTRVVEWQSTAQSVKIPSFEFNGKIIILIPIPLNIRIAIANFYNDVILLENIRGKYYENHCA